MTEGHDSVDGAGGPEYSTPSYASDWFREGPFPFLVAYILPLPDHVPIPDGTMFKSYYGEVVPGLDGAALPITHDMSPTPSRLLGHQFVSLRFRQLSRPGLERELGISDAAAEVVDSLIGRIRPPRTASLLLEALRPQETQTVVEMVTAVGEPSSRTRAGIGAGTTDPFNRCLAFVQLLVRGYRLAIGARIHELSYERLPKMIEVLVKDIHSSSGSYHKDPFLMTLDHAHYGDPGIRGPLDDKSMEDLNRFFLRLSHGDPFAVFAERTLQARISFEKVGDYADAVVQTALACEILLDTTLSFVIWEESLGSPDVEAAAITLGRPLAVKLRREFHPRLGGVWDQRPDSVTRVWSDRVAYMRGRVVHRGYRPDREEASQAMAAMTRLEAFIKERLAVCAAKYCRTALSLLGEPGLRRLGAWERVREFAESAREPPWVDSHRAWREDVDRRIFNATNG